MSFGTEECGWLGSFLDLGIEKIPFAAFAVNVYGICCSALPWLEVAEGMGAWDWSILLQ